jgi:kinesin family member 5
LYDHVDVVTTCAAAAFDGAAGTAAAATAAVTAASTLAILSTELLLPLLLLLLPQVREDSQRGIYVAGATEEYVTSAAELLAVMDTGKSNRVTAATGMNAGSSRSHSVFIITLAQRNTETSSVKTGALYLVDLAGSEMVKKTQVNSIHLQH